MAGMAKPGCGGCFGTCAMPATSTSRTTSAALSSAACRAAWRCTRSESKPGTTPGERQGVHARRRPIRDSALRRSFGRQKTAARRLSAPGCRRRTGAAADCCRLAAHSPPQTTRQPAAQARASRGAGNNNHCREARPDAAQHRQRGSRHGMSRFSGAPSKPQVQVQANARAKNANRDRVERTSRTSTGGPEVSSGLRCTGICTFMDWPLAGKIRRDGQRRIAQTRSAAGPSVRPPCASPAACP